MLGRTDGTEERDETELESSSSFTGMEFGRTGSGETGKIGSARLGEVAGDAVGEGTGDCEGVRRGTTSVCTTSSLLAD